MGRIHLLAFLTLGACGKAPDPAVPTGEGEDSGATEVDCTDPGDWASVGQPFVLSYCTGCHSSHLGEGQRFGAPVDVDLDTLADAQAHAVRAAARVEEGTMPPGAGPSVPERERFQRWAACGGPGLANPMGGTAATVPGDAAADLESMATVDPADPVLVVLRRDIRQSSDWRTGLLSLHAYVVDGDEGWLVAIEEYDADEVLVRALELDPPLQVAGPGTEGEHALTAYLLDASGEATLELEWSVSVDADFAADPRITGAPQRVLALSDNGLELSWLIDRDDGLVGQLILWPDGSGQTVVQGSGGLGTRLDGAFPVFDGLIARELALSWSTP